MNSQLRRKKKRQVHMALERIKARDTGYDDVLYAYIESLDPK